MATYTKIFPSIINIFKQKVSVKQIGVNYLLTENLININRRFSSCQHNFFSLSQPSSKLITSNNLNFIPRRWKQNKKQSEDLSDDDSDEDEEIDEDIKNILKHNKNAKIINPFVNSMRLDAITKTGMAISRNKIEVALYESKIRLNEKKVPKKSVQVGINDVIDLIEGPDPKNTKNIIVTRLTVLDGNLHEDGYRVKMLREKFLVIPNYDDKWSPITEELA